MTFIMQHLDEIVDTLFVIKTQGLHCKIHIYVSWSRQFCVHLPSRKQNKYVVSPTRL